MHITDNAGNPYPFVSLPAPPITDFTRLQAAIADRAPTLRLHRRRLENGSLVFVVMVPGLTPGDPWHIGAYIARAFHDAWQIHHPEDGPQMEFNTAQQIAKFLSVVPDFAEGWHERWGQWMAARGERFADE
jgi:hypothetical protein